MRKIFSLLSFALLFTSCCGSRDSFVTEQRDAWIQNDAGLYYCRANVKEGGDADPTCFEAGFHRYRN